MIEAPIKAPPPTGQPVEPPVFIPPVPDAPPPEWQALHDRVCEHCLAPIHPDQAACLSCGKIVEDGGGVTWRRGALASIAALLLVGGAVGAAVAGLPHGKKVPKVASKRPTGQPFGQRTLPPATASPTPSTKPPTAKLPKTPKAPPAIHSGPSTPAPSGGTGSSPSPSSGSRGGSSPRHHSTPKKKHKHTAPGASSDGLFTTGVSPSDGNLFDPEGNGKDDHPDDVINTYDSEASTAWRTKIYQTGDRTLDKTGVGVEVRAGTPGFKALGILTRTPGFKATVYYSMDDTPPAALAGWKQATDSTRISKRQRVGLKKGEARKATWYLVWITLLPSHKKFAAISEIQLLQ